MTHLNLFPPLSQLTFVQKGREIHNHPTPFTILYPPLAVCECTVDCFEPVFVVLAPSRTQAIINNYHEVLHMYGCLQKILPDSKVQTFFRDSWFVSIWHRKRVTAGLVYYRVFIKHCVFEDFKIYSGLYGLSQCQ